MVSKFLWGQQDTSSLSRAIGKLSPRMRARSTSGSVIPLAFTTSTLWDRWDRRRAHSAHRGTEGPTPGWWHYQD